MLPDLVRFVFSLFPFLRAVQLLLPLLFVGVANSKQES